MILSKVSCHLDTIHITITRPRNVVSFLGETGEPTDTIFYKVLEILAGKNFQVFGGSKKFVNNGTEYIQSNTKEILIQLRSAHLMMYGRSKVAAILDYLNSIGVPPKPKRNRKKEGVTQKHQIFYQLTRLDFAVDYETKIDLVKILNEKIGYSRFFQGIQKGYFYRVIHNNTRTNDCGRSHKIKEFKVCNSGFELAVYNKKVEIIEVATAEKLALYPPIYREILIEPSRQLFRVELRYFRTRSIAFNHLTVDEIFNLPRIELVKFGKSTRLIKVNKTVSLESTLFNRLFEISIY